MSFTENALLQAARAKSDSDNLETFKLERERRLRMLAFALLPLTPNLPPSPVFIRLVAKSQNTFRTQANAFQAIPASTGSLGYLSPSILQTPGHSVFAERMTIYRYLEIH